MTSWRKNHGRRCEAGESAGRRRREKMKTARPIFEIWYKLYVNLRDIASSFARRLAGSFASSVPPKNDIVCGIDTLTQRQPKTIVASERGGANGGTITKIRTSLG